MKETTRQLILLTAVVTILISGLVAYNSVRDDESTGSNTNREVQSSSNNSNSTPENLTQVFKNSSDSNIFIQSIGGLISLWEDFQAGSQAIAGSTSSSRES